MVGGHAARVISTWKMAWVAFVVGLFLVSSPSRASISSTFSHWSQSSVEKIPDFDASGAKVTGQFVRWFGDSNSFPIAQITEFEISRRNFRDFDELTPGLLRMLGAEKWNLERKDKGRSYHIFESDRQNRIFIFCATPRPGKMHITVSSIRRGGYARLSLTETLVLQKLLSIRPSGGVRGGFKGAALELLDSLFAHAHAAGGSGLGTSLPTGGTGSVPGSIPTSVPGSLPVPLSTTIPGMGNLDDLVEEIESGWGDAQGFFRDAEELAQSTLDQIQGIDPVKAGAIAAGTIAGINVLAGFGLAVGAGVASLVFWEIPKTLLKGLAALGREVSGKARAERADEYKRRLDLFAEMRGALIRAEEEMDRMVNEFLGPQFERMLQVAQVVGSRAKYESVAGVVSDACLKVTRARFDDLEGVLGQLERDYFAACEKARVRLQELMNIEANMVELARTLGDRFALYQKFLRAQERSSRREAEDTDAVLTAQDIAGEDQRRSLGSYREMCVSSLDDIDPRLGSIMQGCFGRNALEQEPSEIEARFGFCADELRKFSGIAPVGRDGVSDPEAGEPELVENISTLKKYRGSRVFTSFRRLQKRATAGERYKNTNSNEMSSFSPSTLSDVRQKLAECSGNIGRANEQLKASLKASTPGALKDGARSLHEARLRYASEIVTYGQKLRGCFGKVERCEKATNEEKIFNYKYFDNLLYGYVSARDRESSDYDDEVNGICNQNYWQRRKAEIEEQSAFEALR